ncbi:MAG: GGDEF domain-containing protein [Candidatus Scalindua sp.]|nr:GGDEF domain-containing protein [Candidatus Scalindua sp.]
MKFILPLIVVATLFNIGIYLLNSSSPANNAQTKGDYYTYKTPDNTIWLNTDKEALRRLRSHYIRENNNKNNIVISLEAEKEQIIPYDLLDPQTQKKIASTYNLCIRESGAGERRSFHFIICMIFNTLIISTGFILSYIFYTKRPTENPNKTSKIRIPEKSKDSLEHPKETQKNIQVLNKAKEIICEILQNITRYSDNCFIPKSKKLEEFTNNQIPKIGSSLTIEEFLTLEDEINKIIPSHFETVRKLIQTKFDELKTLINSFAEDLGAITKDNTDFSGQIKSSISHIEKAIELDEIIEIRRNITKEVVKMGKNIIHKQERDCKIIKTLTRKVQSLDKELVIAKEEILIDGLTQIANRKALDRKLAEAINSKSKTRKTFTLVMADIDYFKNINDTYGHIVGDQVLKKVSATITKNFRLNDFVARYGGEEFAIILDRISKQHIQYLCERLRSDIESLDFRINSETIPISISIGVAFCGSADTIETLLYRADKTLYLAKKSGRNNVKTEEQLMPAAAVNI